MAAAPESSGMRFIRGPNAHEVIYILPSQVYWSPTLPSNYCRCHSDTRPFNKAHYIAASKVTRRCASGTV